MSEGSKVQAGDPLITFDHLSLDEHSFQGRLAACEARCNDGIGLIRLEFDVRDGEDNVLGSCRPDFEVDGHGGQSQVFRCLLKGDIREDDISSFVRDVNH